MIDYLEQLLDQVPAEEQETFPWLQTKMGYVATGANGEKTRLAEGEVPVTERNDQQEQKQGQVQAADWEIALAGATARAVGWQEQRWGNGSADRELAWTGLPQQDGQQEQKWASRSATGTEPVREADLEKALSELGRAVVRGKTSREPLAWKHKTASEAAAEGGATTRRRDEVRMELRRGLVSRLDAAFERDARRYDGPLGLF